MAQAPKRSSRTAVASGAIVSHEPSGVFDKVTKSAVMKTLVTPAMASNATAIGSSVFLPATNVAGPPTSTPTVNLSAFGFGVFDISTVMVLREASARASTGPRPGPVSNGGRVG